MRLLAAFTIGMLLPVAAEAQGTPSFDCAKAGNAVERTICKDDDLRKADREMAAHYTGLAGRLTGQARDSLQKGQVSWIVGRNRACTITDADEMSSCLKRRYGDRIAELRASGSGPYPFIERQRIDKKGRVGKASYSIDIVYPLFAGSMADFSAINAAYASSAAQSAREATPTADAGLDREQEWSAEGGYALYRPTPDLITVALSFWSYTGGAHGNGSTSCALVDLRTGRKIEPADVFAAGSRWREELVAIVRADLRKQFVENPGFDDALRPVNLTKTLQDSSHYCWQAGKLQLYFNPYEVGPYAAGPYTVDVPYERLKPLLRTGGPIT